MANLLKTAAAGALVAFALATASAVYAEQSPSDSRMRSGMRNGGMMGMQGGMMGMGSMMGQTGGMMEGCNGMMQGNQPPNSQFRRPSRPPAGE